MIALGQWTDEIFLAFSLILDRHYLKHYGNPLWLSPRFCCPSDCLL